MLRLPYKLLALTSAVLLFCTGCQLRMGYPEELYSTGITTTAEPQESEMTPAKTTTEKKPDPQTPDSTESAPVTTPAAPDHSTPTPPQTEAPEAPKKQVAFTFDDGPHSSLTYKFVDKLKEYNATATFFVIGNRVDKAGGAAIAYAYENGCEIGIHSYTHSAELYYHVCTDAQFVQDMQQTADAINTYVPAPVTLLRPPGGHITTDRIKTCPYGVILWNVDSLDWQYKSRADEATIQANVDTIVDNVMSQISDGDIVLMHEIYENSYEAFCIIIERLYADGYEVVSVSELLGDKLQPGQKYSYLK